MSSKILILEDEQAIRQSYVYYFEDHNWNPLEAENGEEALVLVENEAPEYAIVDIRLNGMDGYEFIKRAHEIKPSMVFVVCTGSLHQDIPEALSYVPGLSFQRFCKPVEDISKIEEELLETMRQAVKGKIEKNNR